MTLSFFYGLSFLIDTLNNKSENLILAGDINIDVIKNNTTHI